MTASIAAQLWRARLDGTLVAKSALAGLRDDAAAYAVMEQQIAGSGLVQTGWKLGATGQVSLQLLGLDAPFIGPVYDRFQFADGAEVAIHAAHASALETEFTVRLGADLPARAAAWTRAEIDEAVDAVIPSFEIVGFRFDGGPAGAGRAAIADGGANAAVILGTPVPNWRDFDLRDHPVTVHINDRQVAVGSNAALVWDHTVDAVVWLANHPALGGRGLKAGDIVMTGTCAGLLPLRAGDRAMADFGTLGRISASFTDAGAA